MEEQIYQVVWCQAFARTFYGCKNGGAADASAEALAGHEADVAAAAAVRKWDESKRLTAITSKNEGK
jgi:hypothetical protein